MEGELNRPDVASVLGTLKDFQRTSVEYVFRRLYLDKKPAQRFLVADEVGLGKTLVARGVIAKAVEHLIEQEVPRIDIVYICSNRDIARQNINRLNVTGQDEFALASRITLLPVTLKGLKKNRINFISFTPGTAFELRGNLGTWKERALIYWLLQDAWNLKGKGPLNVFQGTAGRERFRREVKRFREGNEIDKGLNDEFRRALLKHVMAEREAGKPDIRTRFDDLAQRFGYARDHYPLADRKDRAQLVGELRGILATSCLEALEPDLIILDEFQRFKHLFEGEDDASELARNLFEYEEARVLLLSATPYKMYTLEHEAGSEDHYEDFVRTVSFLQRDPQRTSFFQDLLATYRREALTCGDGDISRLREAKAQLEIELRRVMIRNERLGVTEDRSGMLTEMPARACQLQPRDVDGYLSLQKVARAVGHPDTLEYWKSGSYLLSFMDDYELKKKTATATGKGGEEANDVAEALAGGHLSLPWSDLVSYQPLDPGNARLRCLAEDTVGRGLWRLLWLPPALPYYQVEGPFADAQSQELTKRLVFSSWRVVPKVIAGVLSYEAEREMMQSLDPKALNTPEARKRRRGLLRFAREADGLRLVGMPVLGLMYPSLGLVDDFDPLPLARECGANGEIPPLEAVLTKATEKARTLLPRLVEEFGGESSSASSGAADENWYWAAPILVDVLRHGGDVRAWLSDEATPDWWAGEEEDEDDDGGTSAWSLHVERAVELLDGQLKLGRPPEDLAQVIALLGLAGPGVALTRSLARAVGGIVAVDGSQLRDAAAPAAWAARNLFNLPETMAVVRGLDSREPYWRRVLEYCAAGGFQAVLDEYVHVLRESLALLDKEPEEAVDDLSKAIQSALTLRTAGLNVDVLEPSEGGVQIERQRMRARFAVRFGQEQSEEGAGVNRAEQVRSAFNSPFWPFVLASTSVGQEGLDFHPYCHAVVHWNLPSNPVDLEQREGRVHRYKGHAVRKNVARRFSLAGAEGDDPDPWMELFAKAASESGGHSDMSPYWVYQVPGGARIERHVPTLPLSRDSDRLGRLRQSLAAYRMVFGQARQEELLAYLLNRFPEDQRARLAEDLRIDLSPPQAKRLSP